jgi:hypothetical protein
MLNRRQLGPVAMRKPTISTDRLTELKQRLRETQSAAPAVSVAADAQGLTAWLTLKFACIAVIGAMFVLKMSHAFWASSSMQTEMNQENLTCVTVMTPPGNRPATVLKADPNSPDNELQSAWLATETCVTRGCQGDLEKQYFSAISIYLSNRAQGIRLAYQHHGRDGLVARFNFHRNSNELAIIDGARELMKQDRLDFAKYQRGNETNLMNLLIKHRNEPVPVCEARGG